MNFSSRLRAALFALVPLPSLFFAPIFAEHVPELEGFAKNVSVVVETQAGSGSGVIIGKRSDYHALLTAKHVLGGSSRLGDFEVFPISGSNKGKRFPVVDIIDLGEGVDAVILVFKFNGSLKVSPILSMAPDYLRRDEFTSENNPKGIDHYNPRLENIRSYYLSGINFFNYDEHQHILGDPIVAGVSLPTAAITSYLYRFSPVKIIDRLSGNKDGYNLIYLATSTVPGMSGGGVFGARRCPGRMDWYRDLEPGKGGDGTRAVYYGVVGIHGRSEAYGSTASRSGISLGLPLDDFSNVLLELSTKLGIPLGSEYLKLVQEMCAKDNGF